MTHKEWVKRLFFGEKPARIPFVPLVYGHAAKLEQISVRAMSTDPGKLSKALQNAWRLYGYDAIVCPFDPSLEAEACGWELTWQTDDQLPHIVSGPPTTIQALQINSVEPEKRGRLPVVLEAMRRTKMVLGQSVASIAVATGPLSLISRLLGKNVIQELEHRPEETKQLLNIAGGILTRIARVYCELGSEVLALADDYILQLPAKHFDVVSPIFRTISNLVRFYNAYPILVTRMEAGQNLDTIAGLDIDGAVIGGEPEPIEIKQLKDKGLVIGIGIPLSIVASSGNELNEFISRYFEVAGKNRFFLSTEWEVPYETPPEKIHSLVEFIASLNI